MRKLVLAFLTLLVGLAPTGGVAQEASCDGNFHIVHELGGHGELFDLDFAAANDGWAVGFDYENDDSAQSGLAALGHGPQERPWVVRFDRNSFESITPPHELGTQLASVEAIAPNDVYAAGYRWVRSGRAETVIYHWDGLGWTLMETPSPGARALLKGIVAVTPTDIWAVGHFYRRDQDRERTLVLHFDGTTWQRVPSPSLVRYSTLKAVDAVSDRQVWAVGGRGTRRPLVLRWNGTQWRNVRVPKKIGGAFEGLNVVARNELWATGRRVVRFLDGRWRLAKTPDVRGSETYFDIAAARDALWSVGHRFVLRPYETVIPLAVRRSDGVWQSATFEGNRYGHIDAVALDATGAAWAVGETFDPEGPDAGDVIEMACSS